MCPSRYYTWDTQATIPQNPGPSVKKELSSSVDMEGYVTRMTTAPSNNASESTGTTVRVTKFNAVYYRHVDLLLRVKKNCYPEIHLGYISDGYVLSFVQFCRAY